ncbi:MAG: hypothetical protein ACYDCN_07260, partial [Bacteroidia bacterium]
TPIELTNIKKYGFNSIKSVNTTIIPSISIHCESSKIILGTGMQKLMSILLNWRQKCFSNVSVGGHVSDLRSKLHANNS